MNGDPRIIREPELEKEQSAFAVNTKLLDELAENRKRIGTTQGNADAMVQERARLKAERNAIIARTNKPRDEKTDSFHIPWSVHK